jgi:hypothetical protein
VPTAELETVAGVGRECRAGGEGGLIPLRPSPL